MSSEVHRGRRCPPLNSSGWFTCKADVKHSPFLKKTLSSLLAWESDLQSRMEGGTSSGPNSNYKYNMQSSYITPVQLHHVNHNIPDCCIKCKKEIGTTPRCMWSCGILNVFWKEVLGLITKLTKRMVPFEAKLCSLHIYSEDHSSYSNCKETHTNWVQIVIS